MYYECCDKINTEINKKKNHKQKSAYNIDKRTPFTALQEKT